jgi:uncharacterized membrane protein YeaQ/YmgE (transglycosylase-associated protein family)
MAEAIDYRGYRLLVSPVYLIAGFIGACILIAIARAFSGGLQQRT